MKSFVLGSVLFALFIGTVQPTCVLESDFGFKINCAFKKAGLFRVRNLGGIKAHASLGFSLGDELGFEQSLTNLDTSKRRSVSVKSGAPNLLEDASNRTGKQEKRGKQNRIMMRPAAPSNRVNPAAMEKLSTLHRRASTMPPIIITGQSDFQPMNINAAPKTTIAKPFPMGVPPFKPLPPKEETLKVIPIMATTKRTFTPLQIPESKGPGMAYQNPVPQHVHQIASQLSPYGTKKVDDYNSITGFDDTSLKFNKDDINEKIAEIAKAGNISMEAVEAAIALRQQQLLSKYANIQFEETTTSSTTTTTTTPKPLAPVVFEIDPEPEVIVPKPTVKPKRQPTSGKVMNAPREYYPVGYEKNFDDQFQSRVDLPDTSFHCGDQKYFPGLYGDESLGCMVFHVCALTDDGLVMKSFLCPESTLFDQTILKCNWWFYVDCKSTRKLYDTNIPVSKSYQLMKALTFFSSYNKDSMQEDGAKPPNPEDIDGVKEAINILQSQDEAKVTNTVQIVTPQPSRAKTEQGPIYRANRNFRNVTRNTTPRPQQSYSNSQSQEIRTTLEEKNQTQTSTENIKSNENSREKVYRRRLTLKTKPIEKTTEKPIMINTDKETIVAALTNSKEEKLTDQIESASNVNLTEVTNLTEVKRVSRSSVEETSKEIDVVGNEKVQVIRPTSTARLVGEVATPTAAIAKLDEAILGKLTRHKKEIPEDDCT